MFEMVEGLAQTVALVFFAGSGIVMCVYMFIVLPLMTILHKKSKNTNIEYPVEKVHEIFFESKNKKELLELEERFEREFKEWKVKNNIK